ncbi:MAG: hypothetical protein M0Z28_10845 [Rhodospirillales bacterium]|nr:hypothetical protein [Rhodospirillales bacterium]
MVELLDDGNAASAVLADAAYRWVKNEALLADRGLVSRSNRKKPKSRPMMWRPRHTNAR